MNFVLKSWILIAVVAYFFHAVTAIIDKFLLEKRISRPSTYAFYVGIFGIFAVFLSPFGFFVPQSAGLIFSVISGFISVFAFYTFFITLQKSEATRITPIIGGFSPIFVLLLSRVFLKETLEWPEFIAFFLLIAGGILVSLAAGRIPDRIRKPKTKKFFLVTILSAFLFALAYVFFKASVAHTPFINAFVWSRLGGFAAAFLFLIGSSSRKDILSSPRLWLLPVGRNGRDSGARVAAGTGLKNNPRGSGTNEVLHVPTGAIFMLNKFLGAAGFFLLDYAISMGRVSVVNAMQGVEYALIFIFAAMLSKKYPDILKEDFSRFAFFQKGSGVALVAVGLTLLAFG